MLAVWVVALLAADQATKIWAQATFSLGSIGREIVPDFLWFTYVRNTGAAFGLLDEWSISPTENLTIDGTVLLGLLSAAVSIAIVRHLFVHRRTSSRITRTAFAWVLAGALGNMIDRFRLGYVIDFVHVRFGPYDFPVFNVADASVFCGAVLLAYLSLKSEPTQADATPSSSSSVAPDDRAGHEPQPEAH